MKNQLPPSKNSSSSATRFLCASPCSARNSRLKRVIAAASKRLNVFSATSARRSSSNASYTTPIPPSPMRRRMVKRLVGPKPSVTHAS